MKRIVKTAGHTHELVCTSFDGECGQIAGGLVMEFMDTDGGLRQGAWVIDYNDLLALVLEATKYKQANQ